jgi:hypothetical protein
VWPINLKPWKIWDLGEEIPLPSLLLEMISLPFAKPPCFLSPTDHYLAVYTVLEMKVFE